jgi:hypothetical protein
MRTIPLQMIEDGGKFRFPGKQVIFTKTNNMATISIEGRKTDGSCYIEDRPACVCRTPKGKIFNQDWFSLVEEI